MRDKQGGGGGECHLRLEIEQPEKDYLTYSGLL